MKGSLDMKPHMQVARVAAVGLGLSAAAILIALFTTLATPAGAAQPGNVEISIDNFSFSPATVTIKPGTTVKWVNRDDIPHTIVDKELGFKSKALDTDDAFAHAFEKPGEVEYFCSLHPHMVGHIIVQ